jgi:hypothetical protein
MPVMIVKFKVQVHVEAVQLCVFIPPGLVVRALQVACFNCHECSSFLFFSVKLPSFHIVHTKINLLGHSIAMRRIKLIDNRVSGASMCFLFYCDFVFSGIN